MTGLRNRTTTGRTVPAPRPPVTANGKSLRESDRIDERLFVASVEKAMKVLETFDKQARSLAMSDIAQRTGMGRSATQRFVYTLEALGYLKRDPSTRRYALATKVFRFAHSVLSSNTALDNAYQILWQLNEQTRETISWVELDGDEIVIIGNIPSGRVASINLPVGTRFPALSSSTGQVLLGYAPEDQVTAMLARADDVVRNRLGRRTPKALLEMLAGVRRAGFAVTEKNLEQGSVSISAPVFDYAGRPIAAINLSTLQTRYSFDAARRKLAPLVVAAARAASAAIVT